MWDIYNYYGRLHPAGDRQDRQTHRSPFAEGGHPAEKRGGRGRLRNRLDGVGGGARSGYRHSAGPGGLYRRADPRVWLQRREPGKIRRAAVRFRGRFARSGRDGPARLRHYGHLPLSGRKEGSGFPEPLLHPQGVGEYDCPIARRRRTVAIPVCAG